MRAEIILRRLLARLAHGGESFTVAQQHRIFRIEIFGQEPHHFRAAFLIGHAEERPGAFAMALDQAGFGQQLEMARNARLRLAQDFGQIGDGQLGLGEQRKDAQPRGLGRRPQCRMDQFEWQPVDHQSFQRRRTLTPKDDLGRSDIRKHIRICLYGNLMGASPIWRLFRARSNVPAMPEKPEKEADFGVRPGEITVPLPDHFDASVYFIGRIRTPWIKREDCPKNARESDAVCTIEVDPRWAAALAGGRDLHPSGPALLDGQIAARYRGAGAAALQEAARHLCLAVAGAAQSDRDECGDIKGGARAFVVRSQASIASTTRR